MNTTEKLLLILGSGKKNSVKRSVLAERMGMDDRAMREAVSTAIKRDMVCVCNDQDGQGYYIADCQEEVNRGYAQTLSRGRSVLARLKAFRKSMGLDGQITLDELIRLAEAEK